jgi:hypothetical protein
MSEQSSTTIPWWLAAGVTALAATFMSNQMPRGTAQPVKTDVEVAPAAAAKPDANQEELLGLESELEQVLFESLNWEGKQSGKFAPGGFKKFVDARANLHFIVATVSDPIASRFPLDFDQTVETLELGASRMKYVLDRYSLPWPRKLMDIAKKKIKGDHLGSNVDHHARYPERTQYEGQPGIVVFRRSDYDGAGRPSSSGAQDSKQSPGHDLPWDYLVVLLVGETPTSGIDKRAFKTALDWCYRFGKPERDSTNFSIHILGPRYSGSQFSMHNAIRAWSQPSKPENPPAVPKPGHEVVPQPAPDKFTFHVISGAATAVDKGAFEDTTRPFQTAKSAAAPTKPETTIPKCQINFHATCHRTEFLRKQLQNYINEQHDHGLFLARPLRVAWLVEAGTGFGASLSGKKNDGQSDKTGEAQSEQIVFPLHISQVFQAYKQQGLLNDKVIEISESLSGGAISLPVDADSGATDLVPNYNPAMSAVTADLELTRIIRTISHGEFDYLGIIATDVRDRIFLARIIAEHCPDVRLMIVHNDLSYLHPEVLPYTNGCLVATTYPLIAQNQTWSFPHQGSRRLLSLPSDVAVGIYNAMLQLMSLEHQGRPPDQLQTALLEYGIPFDARWLHDNTSKEQGAKPKVGPTNPPVWIVEATRAGFMPIKVFPETYEKPDPTENASDEAALLRKADQEYLLATKFAEEDDVAPDGIFEIGSTGLLIRHDWILLTSLVLLFFTVECNNVFRVPKSGSQRGPTCSITGLVSLFLLGSVLAFLACPFALVVDDYRNVKLHIRETGFTIVFWCYVLALIAFVAFAVFHRVRLCLQSKVEIVRQLDIPAILAGTAVAVVLLCATSQSLLPQSASDFPKIFAIFRYSALFSGSSVVWPVITLVGTVSFWLSDLQLQARYQDHQAPQWPLMPPSDSTQCAATTALALTFADESRQRVADRYRDGWCGLWRENKLWCVLTVIGWLGFSLFTFLQATPTHEQREFDVLIHPTIVLLTGLVAFRLLSLNYFWKELHRLLDAIARLPLTAAFSRLPAAYGQRLGRYLDAERGRTAHQIIAAQAADAVLTAARRIPVASACNRATVRTANESSIDLADSEKSIAEICQLSLAALVKPEGPWAVIRPAKGMAESAGASEDATVSVPEGSDWQVAAEDLLALQCLRHINQYLAYLRSLCWKTIAISLLLLLGVTSYPVRPQMTLAIATIGLTIFSALLVVLILFQMNKNEVLSRINKTTPNQISWNQPFFGQLLTLLGPVVLILLVQVPGIGQFVRTVVEPALRVFTVNH